MRENNAFFSPRVTMRNERHKEYYGGGGGDLEIEEAVVIQSFSKLSNDDAPDRSIASVVASKGARLAAAIFIVVALGMGFIGIRHSFYKQRAEANIARSIHVPAVRGIIYDRYQKPLLENAPGFRLVVIPSALSHDREERRELFKILASLAGMGVDELMQKFQEASDGGEDEVVLSRDITVEQAIYMRAYNPRGVRLIDEVKRKYIDGEVFSHIIGYTGVVSARERAALPMLYSIDTIGKNGLEGYYDELLRGRDGTKRLVKNVSSRKFEEAGQENPVAGYSLDTTLDGDFQRYFYQRFQEGLRELGRDRGVGIAINPSNGEILSLVSFPSYDNNWFSSPSLFAKEIINTLNDSRMPLFNRAVSGLYNPGSTIKPLVAFAALEERIVEPRKFFDDPGYLLVPNPYNPEAPSVFVDWREHGPVDMRKALAVSANVYFYIVGGGTDFQKGLGIAKLVEYFSKFQLHQRLGIDVLGEEYGRMPQWDDASRKEVWRLGDTYNVSIGQGELRITPLGLVSYIAALANGGTLYRPHVGKRIRDKEGNVVQEIGAEIIAQNLGTPAHVDIIKEGMRDVIQKPYGTGFFMSDVPFPVAGKSGTAQVGNKKTLNALFTAFAPVEDPQIAILVLVEDAREGGRNALPIAKDVLIWYYTNRGLRSE